MHWNCLLKDPDQWEAKQRIFPDRGLCQEGPLSHYLFVISANVLSGILRREARDSNIHGIKIARNTLVITHIFFVDDNLLFTRENVKEVDRIMSILQQYQEASGQVVKLEKYEASFSRNMDDEGKILIWHRIGVKMMVAHAKYLRLPTIFGKSKKVIFSQVIDMVWKKVKGWIK